MKAQRIRAYECNKCHHIFHAKDDAEKCCRCKCGEPIEDLGSGLRDHRCNKCRRRDWKRDAQTRVRMLRRDLASAEEHLASLSKERP